MLYCTCFREILTPTTHTTGKKEFTEILYSVSVPRVYLKIAAVPRIMTAVAESLFVGRSLGQCNKIFNLSVAQGDRFNSLRRACILDTVRKKQVLLGCVSF